jgi:hypothetical protein
MIALLEAKAAGLWSRKHIANNILAGLVVGIVALPLAMAFAIASGARPERHCSAARDCRLLGPPAHSLPFSRSSQRNMASPACRSQP